MVTRTSAEIANSGIVYQARFPLYAINFALDDTKTDIRKMLSKDTTNTHFWHKNVMRLFPDNLPFPNGRRAAARILFRVERDADGDKILVQSVIPFENIHLIKDRVERFADTYVASHRVGGEVLSRNFSAEKFIFQPGGKVRFRLAINAVKCEPAPKPVGGEKTRGRKIIPLRDAEERFIWLEKKLSPGLSDLTLLNDIVEIYKGKISIAGPAPKKYSRNNSSAFKEAAPVSTWTVDGVATVSDSANLQKMLLEGVGKAKSYGCGLLSVAILK